MTTRPTFTWDALELSTRSSTVEKGPLIRICGSRMRPDRSVAVFAETWVVTGVSVGDGAVLGGGVATGTGDGFDADVGAPGAGGFSEAGGKVVPVSASA